MAARLGDEGKLVGFCKPGDLLRTGGRKAGGIRKVFAPRGSVLRTTQ